MEVDVIGQDVTRQDFCFHDSTFRSDAIQERLLGLN